MVKPASYRLKTVAAEYGARQVLIGGPAISQEQGEARYRDVEVQPLSTVPNTNATTTCRWTV